MDLHLRERRRFELVLKVIPRNRRFLICRDTVVTEKRVSINAIVRRDKRDKRISSIYISS